MERVGILINKLQEQLKQQADAKSMLITVQMLSAELMQTAAEKNGHASSKVAVFMPQNFTPGKFEGQSHTIDSTPKVTDEAVHQELEMRKEPVVEQHTEEQKVEEAKPVEMPRQIALEEPPAFIKREHSSWIFDPIEAPTFAQQDKVVYQLHSVAEEGEMINDKLKQDKPEVAHILHETPIRDLKKAISINERHRFIEDLFRGDETMYERSVKTINNFNNYAEAEFWMQRELKLKLAWDNNNTQVKLFDQLVRRRFS